MPYVAGLSLPQIGCHSPHKPAAPHHVGTDTPTMTITLITNSAAGRRLRNDSIMGSLLMDNPMIRAAP